MTKVVHLKKEKYDIYIGRGKGSRGKWGNPFSVKKYGRKECLRQYEHHIINNPKLLKDLHELKDKTLGCYCKPLPCHGDILARLADETDS